ncbi:MAG: DUF1844 domain-containing protein [Myxococcales bacterium]|nr:DUF1844 domain-containing protein [Myxococcales bacterium]
MTQEQEPARSPSQSPSAEPEQALPEIDFGTFILSLASNTLVHLGMIVDPDTTAPAKDLALARQTIDILGMLHDKTRGNLTDGESQLLASVLYDLRIKFVDASK